jgi:hypothetical protein
MQPQPDLEQVHNFVAASTPGIDQYLQAENPQQRTEMIRDVHLLLVSQTHVKMSKDISDIRSQLGELGSALQKTERNYQSMLSTAWVSSLIVGLLFGIGVGLSINNKR